MISHYIKNGDTTSKYKAEYTGHIVIFFIVKLTQILFIKIQKQPDAVEIDSITYQWRSMTRMQNGNK